MSRTNVRSDQNIVGNVEFSEKDLMVKLFQTVICLNVSEFWNRFLLLL